MENIKPLKNTNAGFYYFFASMDMKFSMDIKIYTAFTMVVKIHNTWTKVQHTFTKLERTYKYQV